MHIKNLIRLASLQLALVLVAPSVLSAAPQVHTPNPLNLNRRTVESLSIGPALAIDTASNLVALILYVGG